METQTQLPSFNTGRHNCPKTNATRHIITFCNPGSCNCHTNILPRVIFLNLPGPTSYLVACPCSCRVLCPCTCPVSHLTLCYVPELAKSPILPCVMSVYLPIMKSFGYKGTFSESFKDLYYFKLIWVWIQTNLIQVTMSSTFWSNFFQEEDIPTTGALAWNWDPWRLII